MWVTALLGSSTAFVEATLAQLHKKKDPFIRRLPGAVPAYYIHNFFTRKSQTKPCYSLIAVLFAISGLICWCGISQVISNSVSTAFSNAFHIPPLYTTILLVLLAAVIVLRKNATVKALDIISPLWLAATFSSLCLLFLKTSDSFRRSSIIFFPRPSVSARWLPLRLRRCSHERSQARPFLQ